MEKMNGAFLMQDGRLQEGDKIVSINGRPAWCLTCGQVARCLRQNDTVLLGIHRAERYDRYDYMNSSLYCGSSRRSTYRDSVSSDSPRSISYSTASTDSQVRHVHVIFVFYFFKEHCCYGALGLSMAEEYYFVLLQLILSHPHFSVTNSTLNI